MPKPAEPPAPAGHERRIVVFGDVIGDIVVVPSGPIRKDTDTPSSIQQRPGGSAANAASWLGAQGAPVDFVGRVGVADLAQHSAVLSGFGVTPHLIGDPEHPTGAIVVIVEGNSRSMLTERGANDFLTADDVTDELLDHASVVHFTGYTIYHGSDHAAVRRLLERAAVRGVAVSVDPASAGSLADFGAARFLDLIDGAGLLFPNLDEGRALTGLEDPVAIATALGDRFPLVALTLGADGVVVAQRGREPVRIPVVESAIVDPTGAGDAFVAGFLASWTVHGDAIAAATAGATVAAGAVTRVGGRPPAP
jgi:sugar/nucleoside kinase (ribokinase family)